MRVKSQIGPSVWIFNGIWDSVFILNFIWLIPIVAVAMFFDFAAALLTLFLTVIMIPLRDAHTLSPIFAIFMRDEIRKFFFSDSGLRITFFAILFLGMVVIPVSWCIPWHEHFGELGSYLNPVGILGFSWTFLSFWHISMQNYGVLSLYRVRRGGETDVRVKTDRAYSYFIFLVLATFALIFPNMKFSHSWIVELRNVTNGVHFSNAVLLCSVLAGLACIALDIRLRQVSVPRLLFFLSTSLIPVMLYKNFFLTQIVVVTFNHVLVELSLTSKVVKVSSGQWYRQKKFIVWALLVLVLGTLLYQYPLRKTFFAQVNSFAVYRLYGGSFAVENLIKGSLIGFLFTVSLLHFFSDRLLFRMSSRRYPPDIKKEFLSEKVSRPA